MLNEQSGGRFWPVFYRVEEALCIIAMILLALFPAAETFARVFFKTGVPASSALMCHFLLAAGLFAGLITTRSEAHLSIAVVQNLSGDKIKATLKSLSCLVSAFVSVVIAWASLSFIKIGLDGKIIGFISYRHFAALIPLAYGLMALRFARQSRFKGWKILFPCLAIFLGTAASFPVIAKFIWGFDMPDVVFQISDKLYLIAYYSKIPLTVLLLALALAGTPLFVIIGALSLLLLFGAGGEMDSVVSDIYSSLTNPNIVAIPLFTLVGFFLSESKAGHRLVSALRSLFSWIPGGVIIATVIICAFFTSFTGASGVTILALGGILHTILSDHLKYPDKFSMGLLTSVGSIGLLFPPSLPIILVGAITLTNIYHLFLGGILPGLILMTVMIVFGIVSSMRTKIPVEKFNGRAALSGLKESFWELMLPVILICGYFSGIFSLVEIGAIGVLYIFIVEVFIHRDIKITQVPSVFIKAIPIMGGVLAILALSKALSYYIVDTNAPANLAKWMQSAISSKYVFLLLLNLTLLLVGCLMDIFSAILIVLPLLVPLGQAYGVDPVHLGIIFIINLEVGFLTPPVGLNLFLASYRFNKPFVEICRYVFPFLLIQLTVVLLVTYLPFLSTFLIKLF
ncbi:MAG: TRAP transporter large permease subunit [Treponema sp.]|jgi:tripartite ATP-independent transporter DctM subunit|nr:TRAP transporter large permease subunit [Treponema sp.]